MDAMQTRILLVDDHRVLSQGVRLLLQREADFIVVGEAIDGRTAVDLAREHQPQVVVMDISMPELNGVEAARQILREAPGTRVIALTAHTDQRLVTEMLSAGATGYVVKDAAVDELVQAIRTTVAGRVFLSPRITGVVVDQCVRGGRGVQDVYEKLTSREREVLQLTAEGKATKEVARCLSVSVKTAETHRRAIMEKLGLHSVAELTKYAIREGLTTVDH
jgi:DNA-binding NarL/FixJ family response regulator